MDISSLKKTAVLAGISIVITLAVLASFTYAWFTHNSVVNTNLVQGRTADSDVVLLLSNKGGSDFSGAHEAEIAQVNKTNSERLLPVSTDDLKSFVYKADDISFEPSPDGYYYHGRIYMKADSANSVYTRLAIYWDDFENMLKADTDSMLLNAARLGLLFSNGDSRIYYLSGNQNAEEDRVRNTEISGEVIPDGMVLHSSGSAVTVTTDPAISVTSSALLIDGSEPMTHINIGEIYTLDIFFYLEGCDPDCSDAIWTDGADMFLSFYGIPE